MKMLGASAQQHRGKNFWFCCWGHDGWNRKWKTLKKRIRRHREKDSVRNQEVQ